MSITARRIREVRKRLGLKQAEFAERLGVSQTSVSRWESDQQEPEFKQLMEIGRLAGEDPFAFAIADSEHNLGQKIFGQRIRIVGSVEKGKWREGRKWAVDDHVDVVMPTDVPDGHKIEAYIVNDDSCEPRFSKSAIVYVATYSPNLPPRDRDICLFAIKDSRDLWEVTLRELSYFKDMSMVISELGQELRPGHNNSSKFSGDYVRKIYESFFVSALTPLGLIGVVIGSFALLNPTRLPILEHEEDEGTSDGE